MIFNRFVGENEHRHGDTCFGNRKQSVQAVKQGAALGERDPLMGSTPPTVLDRIYSSKGVVVASLGCRMLSCELLHFGRNAFHRQDHD